MRIIGAGLVTADIIAGCTSDWKPGGDPVYGSGGTVTNILSHLAYWGWPCNLIGGVGGDLLGERVVSDLRGFGVNVGAIVVRPAEATRRIGHLVALTGHRRGEHRFVERCFSCGELFPPFVPLAIDELSFDVIERIRDDTILLIDRANPFTLQLAQKVVERRGTVVFEPGYLSRDRDVVLELLSLVDLLKYSDELMWEGIPFKESVHARPHQAKLVIETRGNTGVVARRPGSELRLTTTPLMSVVDTAGAGDAFMAGFLTGLGGDAIASLDAASDEEIETALERGQALGALTCLFIGATSIIRDTQRGDLSTAVDSTMATLAPPVGFGGASFAADWRQSSELLRQEAGERSACPVCLLSKAG
jgi:fructokinase